MEVFSVSISKNRTKKDLQGDEREEGVEEGSSSEDKSWTSWGLRQERTLEWKLVFAV